MLTGVRVRMLASNSDPSRQTKNEHGHREKGANQGKDDRKGHIVQDVQFKTKHRNQLSSFFLIDVLPRSFTIPIEICSGA